ncbi:TraR/DksA family transcriptional regulator [Spirillospora sp. NPDC127200]
MPHDTRGHLSSVQVQALREHLLERLLWRGIELDRLMAVLRDRACPAAEREALYAEITRAEEHICQLQQAIEAMRTGDYGRCHRCGGPIAFRRLKVRPLARLCPRCPHDAAGHRDAAARTPPGDAGRPAL